MTKKKGKKRARASEGDSRASMTSAEFALKCEPDRNTMVAIAELRDDPAASTKMWTLAASIFMGREAMVFDENGMAVRCSVIAVGIARGGPGVLIEAPDQSLHLVPLGLISAVQISDEPSSVTAVGQRGLASLDVVLASASPRELDA